MGRFDAPSRAMLRDHGDLYRDRADRLAEGTRFLISRGRFSEAEEQARELLNFQSKIVGERHPEYATGLSLLAEVLIGRGELNDAETLVQRAIEVRRKAVGERHPDYASSLNQLARIMLRWEDLPAAEPLLRKALEVRQAALGEKHPDYARNLADLADLLLMRDDADKAEPLIREALAVQRDAGGEDRPEYADTLRRLSDALQRRGRFDDAEPPLRQAMTIYKGVLGETHRQHLNTMAALATLLQKKGDLDGSEPIWRLLLDMVRQHRTEQAPEPATILTQLGHLLQRRGDFRGAEDAFRQAIESSRQAGGDRHPEFAVCLTNLAFLLQRVEDLPGAETLFRQALAVRKEVLGPRHPDYATSLINLAQLVQKRGDLAWTRMLITEALDVRRAIFGEQHADYAQGLAALADVYAQKGELKKAESLLRQALDVRGRAVGENHPVYAANLSALAAIVRRVGDLDGAEALLRRALQIRKETVGEDHPDFATNLGNIAWILQRKGDRPGAETLLTRALEIRRKLLGDQHPDYHQTLSNLKSLREDGQPQTPSRPLPPKNRGRHQPRVAHPAGGPTAGPTETADSDLPVTDALALEADPPGSPVETDDAPAHPLTSTEPSPATAPEGVFEPATRGEGTGRVSDAADETERDPFDLLAATAPGRSSLEAFFADDLSPTQSPGDDKITDGVSGGGLESPAAGSDRDEFDGHAEETIVPPTPRTEPAGSGATCPTGETPGQSNCSEPPPADGGSPADPVSTAGLPGADELSQPADEFGTVEASDVFAPNHRPSPVAAPWMHGNGYAGEPEPARSLLMSQSSSHLSQELAAISDRFSELGERLLAAARQLHAPGTPPPDDLLESLGQSRRDFFALRDRVHDLAGSLLVPSPPVDQLSNVHELTGLLDHVAEAEIRQSKSEESRRRSISVLDRVLSLSHSSIPDFAPLRDCHDKARELRQLILAGSWTTLPEEAERLAEGQHHFSDLLSLIEDRDELPDDLWATLLENVGNAFGKALAASAARSKLVLPADAGAAQGRSEESHGGAYQEQPAFAGTHH